MAKSAVAITPERQGPLSVVPRIEQEIERFFGNRWPRMLDMPGYRAGLEETAPKVDVIDRENEIVLKAELPGFRKKEVDISLNDSTVTIKAEHESTSEDKEQDYYRREIASSYVSRTVALPAQINGDKAKANFVDGLLTLTLPKVERSKRQKIKIEG